MNIEEFENEHPEYAKYVEAKIQKAVQMICSTIVSQYDSKISANSCLMEQMQQEFKSLETIVWNENTN